MGADPLDHNAGLTWKGKAQPSGDIQQSYRSGGLSSHGLLQPMSRCSGRTNTGLGQGLLQ